VDVALQSAYNSAKSINSLYSGVVLKLLSMTLLLSPPKSVSDKPETSMKFLGSRHVMSADILTV
jgi:hypothetical protein